MQSLKSRDAPNLMPQNPVNRVPRRLPSRGSCVVANSKSAILGTSKPGKQLAKELISRGDTAGPLQRPRKVL
jgi:hypothetical protein